MSAIRQYRVRNTRNGVELLRLYPNGGGAEVIKAEGGFDNHKLFNGTTIALVDGELKISPPPPNHITSNR